MSQEVTQSVSANIVVLLTKDNIAVTGLTYSSVTARFRKEGGSSFSTKTLTAPTFVEIGYGVYTITFSAADLGTAGSFVVVVTGASIDQSTTLVNVLPATETSVPVSLETCVVTGYVYDVSGKPIQGAAVSATVVGHPSIEQSTAVMQDSTVTTATDANGYFYLPLVRLADVEVYIPSANYRRRFVVPNAATAALFKDIT